MAQGRDSFQVKLFWQKTLEQCRTSLKWMKSKPVEDILKNKNKIIKNDTV
jgi:hypothetical protein